MTDRNDEPFVEFQGQFVRKTVADMLRKVRRQLPGLILYEGWRSFEKQTALFEARRSINRVQFPDLSDRDLDLYTHNQVAIPSKDPKNPSPHATGGAVDVGVKGLDFGCEYLQMCEATRTDCAEIPETAKKNRQLLLGCMEAAGFVNFPHEWWHYEYGIDTWAKVNGVSAFYDGVFEWPSVRLTWDMEGFLKFERDAVNMTLSERPELAPVLRTQYASAKVVGREFSGVGSFTDFSVEDSSLCLGADVNFELGQNILADVPGLECGMGFVMFVRKGFIDMFESFAYSGDVFPSSFEGYTLKYLK